MSDFTLINALLIGTNIAVLCLAFWFYRRLNVCTNASKITALDLQKLQVKQQQLDTAKSDAEAANLAKNRYLSGISHELRTPLNVVMGYAQLLENQCQATDPNKEKYTLMRHNCEHLAHLIEGILEFSAIESGKLKVQLDWIDFHDLLQQLNLMFKNQAEQKGLLFTTEFDPQIPKSVKTDHKRLQQILINLLSNAIKFTDQGQVTFSIKYRNQVAAFSIKDTGRGIADGDVSRMFEPFERLEHTGNTHSGTGLGLPITQLLIDLMGGELVVESQLGTGSEFKVKLMLPPQHKNLPTMATEPQYTHGTASKLSGHQNIMVVDDEASHRQLMNRILQPLGFNLQLAAGGKSAKNTLNEQSVDLAIVDVAMPQMDGWQLAKWIKQKHPEVKVLMLSANPRDLNLPHTDHDAYLTKPVKINQLLHQIDQLLGLNWNLTPTQTATTTALSSPSPVVLPAGHKLALLNMADIGHVNGIEAYLKKLYADSVLTEPQLNQLSAPVKHMNLEAFRKLIDHG